MVAGELVALEPVLRVVLLAFALVIGVMLAVSLRRVLRVRRARRSALSAAPFTAGNEVVPRVLEARGLASGHAVQEMNQREQLFLFEQATGALGPRGTMRPGRPTPSAAAAAQPAAPKPPAALRCPLCTASLVTGSAAAYFLGACPGCGRRISARMEGRRLVLTVDEAGGN